MTYKEIALPDDHGPHDGRPGNKAGQPLPTRQRKRKPLRKDIEAIDAVYERAHRLGIVQSREELYAMLNGVYLEAASGLRKSDISWTGYGWSPIVGCTVCSAGCFFCYAEKLHNQRHAVFLKNNGLWKPGGKRMPLQYAKPFSVVQLLSDRLGMPLRTSRPGRVFVNPSSDVFHPAVPLDFIKKMFLVMGASPHLTFQILTKRPERMVEVMDELPWFPNIHMGVTIEGPATLGRLALLKQLPDHVVKWISAEPLIGPLGNLNLNGVDWVVVGGESGDKKQLIRPTHPDWFRSLRDQCSAQSVAFFFKQMGHWVPEDQLEHCKLADKTAGRPVHTWADGTKSYRFGRVVIHDIFDGQKHLNYPDRKASPKS